MDEDSSDYSKVDYNKGGLVSDEGIEAQEYIKSYYGDIR